MSALQSQYIISPEEEVLQTSVKKTDREVLIPELFQLLLTCSPERTETVRWQASFHYWQMETHSSVLAWRIPGTGEPGGLLSMGSHRVGHNWSDLAAVAAAATMPYFVFLYGLHFKIYFFLLWVLLPQLSCHFHLHDCIFLSLLFQPVCLLPWSESLIGSISLAIFCFFKKLIQPHSAFWLENLIYLHLK